VKYLFVHQNFPGQFLHIARHLAAQNRHDLVFLTEPNDNRLTGVRTLPHARPDPTPETTHRLVRDLDLAARRAELVAHSATALKQLGFRPDIIIGHHGWGELLNLGDVWPDVKLLGYFEFFYRTEGADVGFDPEFPTPRQDFPRIRAKNAINLQALTQTGHGFTPTQWQLSTYPDWAQKKITLLPEGVHLDICKPDPAVRAATLKIGDMTIAPDQKLVTYVARDLEPYRGFHIMMRALPHLLEQRKDIRVVMVGADGVSYGAGLAEGTWRQRMLNELGSRIDPDRIAFPGRVDYADYMKLLQRSDAHVYLSYPFVASWSLREAIATGCAIVASDTAPVREFIHHDQTGLLAPFFAPQTLAENVLKLLEDTALADRLRTNARTWAERHLAMPTYLAAYEALIGKLTASK